MDIYLVGGVVRDMLLGRPGRQRDFVYFGTEEAFVQRHPDAKRVGATFPIFLWNGGEYAPARGADINADLLQRDLTINAVALSCAADDGLPSLCVSHPLALADLRDKVLRPASDSAMDIDPCRAFRAARFAAELPDFAPHPSLVPAMRAAGAHGALDALPAERVAAELQKALAAPAPSRFFTLLAQAGCLAPWFAELAPLADIPAGPPQYHDGSVFKHLMEVVDRLAGDPLRAWMGLCHDLGKGTTPPDQWPHHYQHELLGEALAETLGQRLRLPTRHIEAGKAAALLHMKTAAYNTLRPGTRVDLLMRLHTIRLFEAMFALVRADKAGRQIHEGEEAAKADLKKVLAVALPPEERDLGATSGDRLRALRCRSLTNNS